MVNYSFRWTAVVRGALIRGLENAKSKKALGTVAGRIARSFYGTECAREYERSKHRKSERYVREREVYQVIAECAKANIGNGRMPTAAMKSILTSGLSKRCNPSLSYVGALLKDRSSIAKSRRRNQSTATTTLKDPSLVHPARN